VARIEAARIPSGKTRTLGFRLSMSILHARAGERTIHSCAARRPRDCIDSASRKTCLVTLRGVGGRKRCMPSPSDLSQRNSGGMAVAPQSRGRRSANVGLWIGPPGRRRAWEISKICPKKLEAGQPESGVEGFPETGRPLDPEPGLGGTFKCRPVSPESKLYFSPGFSLRDHNHRTHPKAIPALTSQAHPDTKRGSLQRTLKLTR
jgi:hypothetical protein